LASDDYHRHHSRDNSRYLDYAARGLERVVGDFDVHPADQFDCPLGICLGPMAERRWYPKAKLIEKRNPLSVSARSRHTDCAAECCYWGKSGHDEIAMRLREQMSDQHRAA
jgi:hypothetical protein